MPSTPSRWRPILRLSAAIFFIAAGANHFISPDFYRKIVPPHFPNPPLLVIISGIAEMAGGLGLLIPALRKPAAWGLIALLIAIYPTNIYMALYPDAIPSLHFSPILLWLRLPFQPLLMAWVWFTARD